MKRNLFTDEHDMFRSAFKRFVEKEITPYHEQWEKDGMVSREMWLKAGEQGFLGIRVPEEYGGGGSDDFRFDMIIIEELAHANASGPGIPLHNTMALAYFRNYTNDEQKARFLPKMCSGEHIGAIAMSEPNTGSDLAGVQTTAIRDGDHYVLNGQKTFISNGIMSDVIMVVAKTNPEEAHRGISLLAVERGMEGFSRGRKLEKIGLHAQDTAELIFEDVKVPVENLLGEEGKGFLYLVNQLQEERLTMAVASVAMCEAALGWTVTYCQERTAFGQPIGTFQNSRFKLAEMKTETEVARAFVDKCVMAYNDGDLTADEAAMAKWWTSELQLKIVDQCLQLHGGYGYMMEYPIAKAYIDSRASTIYGGTTEIMKNLIGKSMGF